MLEQLKSTVVNKRTQQITVGRNILLRTDVLLFMHNIVFLAEAIACKI